MEYGGKRLKVFFPFEDSTKEIEKKSLVVSRIKYST